MLVLSQSDVANLLQLDLLIEALAPAMAELSAGTVSQPQRVGAFVQDMDGVLGVMPAFVPSSRVLSVKLVSIFPNNDALGLPTHMALIAVFDSDTGAPLAVMDGTYVTAARTAAGSALATKLLAREDSSVLAVLGTGVQARWHARAIPRVMNINEVRISGRSFEKAQALAQELVGELGIPVIPLDTAKAALAGADIICAATHAVEPVVRREWVSPGSHINAVGLNPKGRELDDATIADSLVVVESRAAAFAPYPAGANDLAWPIRDGVITEDHIHAEVGELVAAQARGRTSSQQITLYKSVGVALQDAVAARLVLEAAQARGLGVEIEI